MSEQNIKRLKTYATLYSRKILKSDREKNKKTCPIGYVYFLIKSKNGYEVRKSIYEKTRKQSLTKSIKISMLKEIKKIPYKFEIITDKNILKKALNILACTMLNISNNMGYI